MPARLNIEEFDLYTWYVVWLMVNGYWLLVPKHVFGLPASDFGL